MEFVGLDIATGYGQFIPLGAGVLAFLGGIAMH
jgi:hypothetical protein